MSVPDRLVDAMPTDTARSWEILSASIPSSAYLAGGTALAIHLQHRISRDLDFFFHGDLDLDRLADELRDLGPFAVSARGSGTLNGLFSATRVQFLSAAGQRRLEPLAIVAGIPVAGIGDLLAMKLKVIGDRGELRDYFDVMTIEQRTGRSVEEGLGLYLARYREPPESFNVAHIVGALGYFDDVDDDDALPAAKDEIAGYWRRRQPQILRNIARSSPRPAVIPQPADPLEWPCDG